MTTQTEATQYIKATLTAFGPGEAISMTKETWTKLHEAMTALAEQPAHQEPYGQVTVVRRPGCVDQHWFYRWPEPPYLDNAAECHTVYTSPPAQRKPLSNEEIGQAARDAHIAFCLNKHQTYEHALTRAVEAAHGIKE